MLVLKKANWEDVEAEYAFVREIPQDENGFTNQWHGVSRETFANKTLKEYLAHEKGEELPEGFVPQTIFFLWNDGEIVGQFRIRHFLNDALREGAGHIGYFIGKEFRGRGFAKEGLRLTLREACNIVPEEEIYLRVNRDNVASLRVMMANGGFIDHEDSAKYYVRIPKNKIPLD